MKAKATVRIMLYLPPDLAEWLAEKAKTLGQPRNTLIVKLLTDQMLLRKGAAEGGRHKEARQP